MKKLLFTFAMLTTGSIYAQTDLKATFEKGKADYDKNPTEAIQQMDDNVRFAAGHSGQFYDKAAMLALLKSRPAAKSETQMSDLRVKQSGSLGVVSGIRNHALILPNGQKMTWKDAFTYTFEWKNNNWTLTDLHHTKIDYQLGGEDNTLTTQMQQKIGNEYKTDSKAFYANRLSDDFRYATVQGSYLTKEMVLKSDKQNIISSETLQPIIFQSGDLAVETGIHKTVRLDKDGIERSKQVAATYVFQRRNGKWMFVSSQQTDIAPPVAEEEAAVKKAIEDLTAYSYVNDGPNYSKLLANTNYISRVSVENGGIVLKLVGDDYRKAIEKQASSGLQTAKTKASRDNFVIRINGNSAFALFDQHNDNADGTHRDSVEERYLEKINGEWKVVNVTVIPKK